MLIVSLNKIAKCLNVYSCISEEFLTVATSIWKGYSSTYKPDIFKNIVKQYIEILDTRTQQDSAELLAQLVELMHKELTG